MVKICHELLLVCGLDTTLHLQWEFHGIDMRFFDSVGYFGFKSEPMRLKKSEPFEFNENVA
jgi:hypothetical protein